MAKESKTNAMRILDRAKIPYEQFSYDTSDGHIDGISIAQKLNQNPDEVYKTLVTKGHSGNHFVFVIPVEKELDLKKAAKSVGEKNVEMIAVKDLLATTGYIRGGCSPVGMKKLFKTVIDASAESLDKMYVSGGRIGLQIHLSPKDLKNSVNAEFSEIIHE